MTKLLVILGTCLAVSLGSVTWAQMNIVRKQQGSKGIRLPEEMFEVPELASLVSLHDGKLVVDNVLDKQMRPKEYASVDIQEGDVVMMVNGTRVKSLEELKKAYAAVAIGTPVRLGIERHAELAIVSFDKADPEKLPKRRIVIRKGGEGKEGGDHDIMMLPGTGLLIGSNGKEVVVEDILDDVPASLKGADVRKGDVVAAVNDTKVASFSDFSNAYAKIDTGREVTLRTVRRGKEHSFTFPKMQGGQQRIIKREND